MSEFKKYLKYKTKYLNLKYQINNENVGGAQKAARSLISSLPSIKKISIPSISMSKMSSVVSSLTKKTPTPTETKSESEIKRETELKEKIEKEKKITELNVTVKHFIDEITEINKKKEEKINKIPSDHRKLSIEELEKFIVIKKDVDHDELTKKKETKSCIAKLDELKNIDVEKCKKRLQELKAQDKVNTENFNCEDHNKPV